MMSAAWPSFTAAWNSPSAATIFARRSRSASASFAIARGIREKLIEVESSDDISHGGLADLIDRIVDVLDHDHRFFRIGNAIVRDSRDVDRHVVLRDEFLRGNLQ